MPINNQLFKNFLNDPSSWLLLISNLSTIFLAMKNGNALSIFLIFWCQGLIIGLFSFIRILCLKDFSTEGFKINNKIAQETPKTKYITAFFFLLAYVIVLSGYLLAILKIGSFNFYTEKVMVIEYKTILYGSLVFFINHLISYFYNKSKEEQKPNLDKFVSGPFQRIIPMHTAIMAGVLFPGMPIFFLIFKVGADIYAHLKEHEPKYIN
jgi:hypothetical protein